MANALTEYVTGSNPVDGTDLLALLVENYQPVVTVSFLGRQTSGVDYSGLSRFYTLECMSNWPGGSWVEIPGFISLEGNDQLMVYTNATPAQPDTTVYRARVWLE